MNEKKNLNHNALIYALSSPSPDALFNLSIVFHLVCSPLHSLFFILLHSFSDYHCNSYN
jgi:hypothetical protein